MPGSGQKVIQYDIDIVHHAIMALLQDHKNGRFQHGTSIQLFPN